MSSGTNSELPIRLETIYELPSERYPPWLKLIQVQIVHRHGPRTPLNYRLPQFYPFPWPLCTKTGHKSPHPGIELIISGDERLLSELATEAQGVPVGSECTLGQLTDYGQEVMRKLGESLRSLYFDKLGFRVAPHEIHLRSTNFPRTIESLHAVLMGLFPTLNNIKSTQKNLPVLTRDEFLEDMYGSTKCHAYKKILAEYADQFAKETTDEAARLGKSLPHIFSVPDLFGHYPSIYGVWDTLYSRQAHGLSLPSGVNASVMAQLDNLAAREWFRIFSQSADAIKFSVGRFIREIDSNLYRRDRRLCIYSAHDSTIAPLLTAFSSGEFVRFPPFGSHIAVELFEEDRADSVDNVSEKFVRVLYNNTPIVLPHCTLPNNHLPSDKSLCRLESFSQAMRQFMPKNYLEECKHSK